RVRHVALAPRLDVGGVVVEVGDQLALAADVVEPRSADRADGAGPGLEAGGGFVRRPSQQRPPARPRALGTAAGGPRWGVGGGELELAGAQLADRLRDEEEIGEQALAVFVAGRLLGGLRGRGAGETRALDLERGTADLGRRRVRQLLDLLTEHAVVHRHRE